MTTVLRLHFHSFRVPPQETLRDMNLWRRERGCPRCEGWWLGRMWNALLQKGIGGARLCRGQASRGQLSPMKLPRTWMRCGSGGRTRTSYTLGVVRILKVARISKLPDYGDRG